MGKWYMANGIIGVICNESEIEVVNELFELFKVPWEYYVDGRDYEVIITSDPTRPVANYRLLFVYSSGITSMDVACGITRAEVEPQMQIALGDHLLPIYDGLASLDGSGTALLKSVSGWDVARAVNINDKSRIVRVGYDLFREIRILLTAGQPKELSGIPSLDLHISLLRNWMLDYGFTLVEIPPVPAGHMFFSCLTHDVDFAGLKYHKLDHTMFGFLYRAVWVSFYDFIRRRSGFFRMWRNWLAVLKLPFVFVGWADDIWAHFDDYAEIDPKSRSTFFLIPFRDRPGIRPENVDQTGIWYRRAARYDIADVVPQIARLVNLGVEVGLHGIDAWTDLGSSVLERNRVNAYSRSEALGVRMHWLCYDQRSASILDEAGFDYDATLGYNDAVGFKNGTLQVFRPLGVKDLLELPLNIQDTSLFYPKRMHVSVQKAAELCADLITEAGRLGGVVTVSWHERSLVPERQWDRFYRRLLDKLQAAGAYFGTAHEISTWFRYRRTMRFKRVSIAENSITVELDSAKDLPVPGVILRFSRSQLDHDRGIENLDFLWDGKRMQTVTIASERNA